VRHRLGILQIRIRWRCLLLGTTVAEVRRQERLRKLASESAAEEVGRRPDHSG
jgi:hypothetical protein